MAKSKIQFECAECGYTTTKWMGNCPSCSAWNSFTEVEKKQDSKIPHKSQLNQGNVAQGSKRPQTLSEIGDESSQRRSTKIPELDRVLGGGLMKGAFILLGGDPGVGKSTLTLQISGKPNHLKVLYCSGEESAGQIKQRAGRLNVESDSLYLFTDTDIHAIIKQALELQPDLLIIDSIQTVFRPEIQSMPGSIAQIRECATLLMRLCKEHGISTICVGHMNKDGDIAGPRILEHMVDTVLMFEGEHNYSYRLLRSIKNRFGSTNEIGVFEMTQTGLIDILEPSQLFLSNAGSSVSGCAITCTMEGTRPLLLEIQALVAESSYGTPQRMANGVDQKRLSVLLAVLEKRCGYFLGGKDVFINVAGGIKIQETASDLALACAVASALVDQPLQEQTVIIGEIGLGAEIRAVRGIDQRVQEAQKMGFKRVILPQANQFDKKIKGVELFHVQKVDDAIAYSL